MTKQEILDALELLKEHTNDDGKTTINGIKAGVTLLQDAPPPQVSPLAPVADVDRRSDVRDPGQADQLAAENLGFANP